MPSINDTTPVIVGDTSQIKVTIAEDGQLSDAICCAGNTFLAVQVPAAFTTGYLYFFSSVDGNNFYQMTDLTGDIVAISTAATATIETISPAAVGIEIALDPAIFVAAQYMKIYCSVAQTAEQTLNLIMAPVLGQ